MAAARKATDEAIRKVYDILNALNVLQPSAALTQLITVLFGIEDRAKLYYISGGKTGGDHPTPSSDSGSTDGSSDGGSTDSDSDSGSGSGSSDSGSGSSDSGSGSGSSDSGSGSSSGGSSDSGSGGGDE